MKKKGPVTNLSGQTFGRWTVLERANTNASGHYYYWCLCECGYKGRIIGYSLKSGKSKSCGCLQREMSAEKIKEVHTMTRHYYRKEVKVLKQEIKYLRNLLEKHKIDYSAVAS
jgi:hypothetical protein